MSANDNRAANLATTVKTTAITGASVIAILATYFAFTHLPLHIAGGMSWGLFTLVWALIHKGE
jgi:hypothetical protein